MFRVCKDLGGFGFTDFGNFGGLGILLITFIMKNQMEKTWKMKWKLRLYRCLSGLGFPQTLNPKIGIGISLNPKP